MSGVVAVIFGAAWLLMLSVVFVMSTKWVADKAPQWWEYLKLKVSRRRGRA